MRIRRARPQDAAAVAALLKQLEANAHATAAPGLQARLEQMLALDSHAVWLAEQGHQAKGLVSANLRLTLWHSGSSALIDELVVEVSARGTGVGRRLIEAVLSWASEQGASEVEVSTATTNVAAQAFYEHCGFRPKAVLLELELDEPLCARPIS